MNCVHILTESDWQRKALRVQTDFGIHFLFTEASQNI